MFMKLIPIGGYGEIGRNSLLIDTGSEAVIVDLGLNMEKYIELTEDESIEYVSKKVLLERDAVPRIDNLPESIMERVKAIIPSHAHLDHVGAIPFLASRFKNATIYGTPFTIGLLNSILEDEGLALPNGIYSVNPGKEFSVGKEISVELISVTHSTPDSSMVAVHTPSGSLLYANDYKLDNAPLLGRKTQISRIKKLSPLKVLVSESLYATTPGKTPSERIARELLRDVILGLKGNERAIVSTTFSSHIARIKSIVELARQTGRRIAVLGRSMHRYLSVANDLGIYELPGDIAIYRYKREINRFLSRLKNPEEYLLVVTGNQGEPKSVLSRMADGLFKFNKNDMVLFSCKVIPSEPNITNRAILEEKLRSMGVRIFTDLHVSGHSYREDLRELMLYTNPEILIPSHADRIRQLAYKELAHETLPESRVEILENFRVLNV